MKNIVLFASGRGSNVQAIVRYFEHSPEVKVRLVVSNKPDAPVLQFAEENNIPSLVVRRETFGGQEFERQLRTLGPDLIVLAGFLWKIPETLIQAFPSKIINIHPALLPKYGGQGMYGARVHEAVVRAKETETGITIHYVNEHYDEGKIILQALCPVAAEDDAPTIQEKVHRLEHFYLPRTIEFLLGCRD